jgi:hypothetical protein
VIKGRNYIWEITGSNVELSTNYHDFFHGLSVIAGGYWDSTLKLVTVCIYLI